MMQQAIIAFRHNLLVFADYPIALPEDPLQQNTVLYSSV
jgi:hypothetical protein